MLNINGGPASAMRSVIGTTGDTVVGEGEQDTVFRMLHELEDHAHHAQFVLPSLAAGITVVGSATSWKLGAKVSLGSSLIAGPFDYHFLNVETLSDNDTHEFCIFKGATTSGGTAISQSRVVKTANNDSPGSRPLMTPILAAGQKTFVQVAQEASNPSTCVISIEYHTY